MPSIRRECHGQIRSAKLTMQLYKPNKPKGTKRRDSIINGFLSSLEKNGFSKTSMTGIAQEANIAPSHVFYYFNSKVDILTEVFKHQCDVIVEGMEALQQNDFTAKINYLSEFFYTENESVNHLSTGVMFEAIGASVADPNLAAHKSELDRCCIELLSVVFSHNQIDEDTCLERAEILYAVIVGSKLNGFFRPDVDLAHGRDLFIKTAYLLAVNDNVDQIISN